MFVSLLIILLAFSRGSMIAFVLMLLYLIWSILFNKKEPFIVLKFNAILTSALFIFFITISSFKFHIFEYIGSIAKYKFILSTPRFELWKDFLTKAINSPDLFIFGENKIFSGITYPIYTFHLHNSYLEIIRSTGILPLVFLFFSLCLLVKMKSFSFNRNNIFTTASLILLLVAAFFEDSLLWAQNYDFLIFWAILQCSKI